MKVLLSILIILLLVAVKSHADISGAIISGAIISGGAVAETFFILQSDGTSKLFLDDGSSFILLAP